MDLQQEKYWDILEFVDEFATKLESEEIDFVAGLIDNDRRGTLTPGECLRVRELLLSNAGGWRAFNEYKDRAVVQRFSEA